MIGEAWWSQPADALLQSLGTTSDGLSSAEARRRQQQAGPNRIEDDKTLRAPILLARQFSSPLVLILVLAALLSLALRDWVEAAIILAVVCGSSTLGFWQEYRASQAVEGLRSRLALMASCRRDGRTTSIPATALVPGDLVELSAGQLVPADARVIEASDFLVVESALTGESLPVEKQPGCLPPDTPSGGLVNAVFLGSSVRSGRALVAVTRTGRTTLMGGIAGQLRGPPPEPGFQRGVRQFGHLLLRLTLFMVVAVLVANWWLGRDPLESLVFAMALAVGMSPELLPAIVAVTLSRGARRMARRGVLVRRLEAMEDLGAMDVLCTDKTGTVTTGVAVLDATLDADGQPSERVADLAFLNAALETGIENPLDAAVLAEGRRQGRSAEGYRKLSEIPYDFTRRRLTVVAAPLQDPGSHMLVTKGAFEPVLSLCGSVTTAAGPAPLDAVTRERLLERYRQGGASGLRVLALATRRLAPGEGHGREAETDLCFEGFLHFLDPPRADAARVIADLARRGVAVKVVTGDNRHVAAHVAGCIGLDPARLLTGAQVATMRDEALWEQAGRAHLFAEVDPQQKARIVRALQHRGRVVGFLGDGINDAPALHAADVGVSVDGAVDVARQTADVVLLRPDLGALAEGLTEGRRTFANTLKYIGITASANFGNMVSMAIAAPALPFLPLAARQILLNNFLSDLPAMTLAGDRVDPAETARPCHWDMASLRRFMLVFGLLSTLFDLIAFLVLLRVFHADEALFQTAWFAVSLGTEVLVLLVLRSRAPWYRSRPGSLLLAATAGVLLVAGTSPWIGPLARAFGFVPLPGSLSLTCLAIVLAYAAATEATKRQLSRTPPVHPPAPDP